MDPKAWGAGWNGLKWENLEVFARCKGFGCRVRILWIVENLAFIRGSQTKILSQHGVGITNWKQILEKARRLDGKSNLGN